MDWVGRTQKMESKADVYRGCAAATTYALIGKRQLEVALTGLAQLLLISVTDLIETEKLLAAIISAYLTLSWSSNISQILSHLVSIAKQSLLQQTWPEKASARRIYRVQCKLRLKVSLDAFFLYCTGRTIECDKSMRQYLPETSINFSCFPGKTATWHHSRRYSYNQRNQSSILAKRCCAIIERSSSWKKQSSERFRSAFSLGKHSTSYERYLFGPRKSINHFIPDIFSRPGNPASSLVSWFTTPETPITCLSDFQEATDLMVTEKRCFWSVVQKSNIST